jgi:DNA modification methylase
VDRTQAKPAPPPAPPAKRVPRRIEDDDDARDLHIADLTSDPENRRAHNPRNIGMIADALQAVGAARSIVIDEDGIVLAGNGVLEAAAEVGITRVHVVEGDGNTVIAVRRRGLTDEQKYKLAMYDNRAGELATWHPEQLAKDVAAGLNLEPFFFKNELAIKLGTKGARGGASDPDAAVALRATDIQPGDVFALGPHRIGCGDSTRIEAVRRVIGDEPIAMVFTDPPYGVNVTGKGGASIAGDISFTAIPLMFDVLDTVLGPRGWLYVCGGQSNMPLYGRLFERYLRQLPRVIVWDKGRTATVRFNGYHSCYELIYYAFREGGGDQWYAPRDAEHADDIWRISVEDGGDTRIHPTQKPVALAARAIVNTCPPEGRVFEPFSGSGSTLLACEQHARVCLAMEIDPQYVQAAIDRWETFTGRTATKVAEAIR